MFIEVMRTMRRGNIVLGSLDVAGPHGSGYLYYRTYNRSLTCVSDVRERQSRGLRGIPVGGEGKKAWRPMG